MRAIIRTIGLALTALVIGGFPAGISFAQVPQSAPPADADAQFRAFLADYRATAIQAGIDPQIWDASMAGIARDPRVEALNLKQPEFVKPVWEYLDGAVSPARVAAGQAKLAAYASALNAIEQRFGVQKEILVAIWGIESDYGREMGGFGMFDALATLAYQGLRSDFGRKELLDALRIEQQEHFAPAQMTSSWAGAFGQTQFVPSAFLRYAVDGDGDGKRDLWHSPADALASAANLLAQSGWERGAPWGYQVVLPASFPYELADPDRPSTINSWRSLGVRAAGGWGLPVSAARAAIYLPAGARGPAFMVFDNFRTVLKYNNAGSYALAVCLLADRLQGHPPLIANWPRDELPLSRPEQLALQTNLQRLGFDPGPLDGLLGRQGRAALRAWQKSRGLIPDGYATESVLMTISVAPLPAANAQSEPSYAISRTIPLGAPDRWDYLTFDAPSGRLYISHGDRVTVVDGKSGAILGAVEGLPGGTHGIAIADPGHGYTDDGRAGIAASFDPRTFNIIHRIVTAPDADGMLFDPFSGHVFVIDGDSAKVTAIDPKTDTVVANIDGGGGLEFGVSGGNGKIYVNGAEKNEVVRIDTRTNKADAHWPMPGCEKPHGLAVDRVTHRLFSSCANQELVVVDADNGSIVATLPIGGGTDAAAFDPRRNLIFSSNRDGTLSVIREKTPNSFVSLSAVKTEFGARTMALDPDSGRIYLVTADFTTNPKSAASDPRHRYSVTPGSVRLLFLDPVTGPG